MIKLKFNIKFVLISRRI